MNTVADKLSTEINKRKFILSITGQPKEAAVRFVNITLCSRIVIQRCCASRPATLGALMHTLNPAPRQKKPIYQMNCSSTLHMRTEMKAMKYSQKCRKFMKSPFFKKSRSTILKRSKKCRPCYCVNFVPISFMGIQNSTDLCEQQAEGDYLQTTKAAWPAVQAFSC